MLWIERIFARMSAMYGRLFADMWAGTDLDEVKAVWIEDLSAFSGAQIAWAMEQCKARDLPPTLPAFRNLCQQAPRPEPIALPAPRMTADEVAPRIAEVAKRITKPAAGSLAWATTAPNIRGAWEKSIIDLAVQGDPRFVRILSEHVEKGVIRSARAKAVLDASQAQAA